MNMIQMKYFITAAKCLNFTKAADKLFITQPALSRQIASMEAELNMQLFIRNNRSVRLTPAAVVLLEGFEKIYNEHWHSGRYLCGRPVPGCIKTFCKLLSKCED